MGYYVSYRGNINWNSDIEEQTLVDALKALNHQHELKTGGRHPKTGDPYEDNWFAWMPARYHEDESLNTVKSILELLGMEVEQWSINEMTQLSIRYDNKLGAEEIFFATLAKLGVSLELEAEGEDGAKWRYITMDNELMEQEAEVSWGPPFPVTNRGRQFAALVGLVANAFIKSE